MTTAGAATDLEVRILSYLVVDGVAEFEIDVKEAYQASRNTSDPTTGTSPPRTRILGG